MKRLLPVFCFCAIASVTLANIFNPPTVGVDLTAPGPIGSVTPGTGAFTTLSASGTVSGTGFTSRFAAPGPIGSVTPSTGDFTATTATGYSFAMSGFGSPIYGGMLTPDYLAGRKSGFNVSLGHLGVLGWSSTADATNSAIQIAIGRNADGVAEFNNGTLGTYRDAILRNITIGGSNGTQVTLIKSATATLDFGSTAAQTSAELTITVTGAAVGDECLPPGLPAAPDANTSYSAYVSATNTVTIRFSNYSAGAVDPPSATFRAGVIKF